MTRAVPPVRRWRVRYWRRNAIESEIIVQAVDKRFARWAAADAGFRRGRPGDRITVSLLKPKRKA